MAEPTIIEFATMRLKADATIEDESSEAGKTWKEITPIVGQADGLVKQFLGRKVEDAEVAVHVLSTHLAVCPRRPQAGRRPKLNSHRAADRPLRSLEQPRRPGRVHALARLFALPRRAAHADRREPPREV
jgi:hypothetical protein